ncbi:P-loop containing nucleoside triphosphate hydrolase protein [Pelagophyceae sp. CCMP2097]|nr:P-loop containing nucleoside triphosphate hydrolase protein [Pelagophyceae sp. CCMP2097]
MPPAWLLCVFGCCAAYALYLRRPLTTGWAHLRINALLRLINALLIIPCLCKDYLGLDVPASLGYMLARPLSVADLMRVAEKRTKLSDWELSETFPLLFDDAVRAMNAVPASNFGRLIQFDYLLRRLMTRLRVVEACKARPPRPDLSKAPIIVMGLPRTGTTLMHRLLSLDPANRCPRTFELLEPLPGTGKRASEESRIKYTTAKLNLIKRVIPQISAIHELGATEAEECLLGLSVEVPLLPPTFRPIIQQQVRRAQAGAGFVDLRNGYRLYRRQLEFIAEAQDRRIGAAAAAARRWVLKCPCHVAFVSALADAFPDAKVVWMHRDPADSLPSLGSMFRTFADMCDAGPVDLHAVGREQYEFWSRAIKKADADLATSALDHKHVRFTDFTANPVGTVKQVYAKLGLKVSPEFEAAMLAYLEDNASKRASIPAHLKKFHGYSCEEYGLSKEFLREEMEDYYETHLARAE